MYKAQEQAKFIYGIRSQELMSCLKSQGQVTGKEEEGTSGRFKFSVSTAISVSESFLWVIVSHIVKGNTIVKVHHTERLRSVHFIV